MNPLGYGRDIWTLEHDKITKILMVCDTCALSYTCTSLNLRAVFLDYRIRLLRAYWICEDLLPAVLPPNFPVAELPQSRLGMYHG